VPQVAGEGVPWLRREKGCGYEAAQVARARQRAPAGEHLDRVDQRNIFQPLVLCVCTRDVGLRVTGFSHMLSLSLNNANTSSAPLTLAPPPAAALHPPPRCLQDSLLLLPIQHLPPHAALAAAP